MELLRIHTTVRGKDVLLNHDHLKQYAVMYAGNENLKNPFISLVYGNLSKLLPVIIRVGTHDVLLGESKMVDINIRQTRGSVELDVWVKMIHAWQFLSNRPPEKKLFRK